MEPVTHVLTGFCLARSGPHRRAAYATLCMGIAAEFPDIDTLWSLRGPVAGFEHHRGITHTFVGIPFEAALLVTSFYLFHHWRAGRQHDVSSGERIHPEAPHPPHSPSAPPRWDLLYVFTLLAMLSHILLDYTNNYGVRPFFPFNPHWFAGSIVFIFDPLIFLLLLAGLLMPFLFGLVGREISGKAEGLRGSGWARAALAAVLALWLFRSYQHQKAVVLADTQVLRAPASGADLASTADAAAPLRPLLLPRRSLASPDPLNPFLWYVATDYGAAYQLGTADTARGAFTAGRILNKTIPTPLMQAAEQTHLGRVYLDWSSMPWLTISEPAINATETSSAALTVNFEDTRFMDSLSFLKRPGHAPLSGQVVLDPSGQVLAEGFGDRYGK